MKAPFARHRFHFISRGSVYPETLRCALQWLHCLPLHPLRSTPDELDARRMDIDVPY